MVTMVTELPVYISVSGVVSYCP